MKHWKWVAAILAVVLILCAAGIGIHTFQKHYVRIGEEYVLRSSESLDLRTLPFTEEEYCELALQMPHCDIRWNIPVGQQRIDSHAQTVVLSQLSREQIPMLHYLKAPEVFELDESVGVALGSELEAEFPNCRVKWVITLGTKSFRPMSSYLYLDGTGVTVEELENKLSMFPALSEVKITDTVLPTEQRQTLLEKYPNIHFQWYVAVDNSMFLNTATHISLGGLDASVQSLIDCADQFEHVKVIDVAGCGLSASELLKLKDAFHAELKGDFLLFDRVVPLDVQELDLSGIKMENADAVEEALWVLPQLKKIILCDCGIGSEILGPLSEKYPQIRFVWYIFLGKCVIRTDATSFISSKYGYWPTGGVGPTEDAGNRLFDNHCVDLKYCHDMVALDLGHMAITDISFLEYMPNLRYLILADTPVEDFTPLKYVPDLIFLELFMTSFNQTELLTQMKDLKALNIGFSKLRNWEPLLEMTWLERLWIPGTTLESSEYHQIRDTLKNTKFVYRAKHSTDLNWRDSDYYRDMRDLLGMPHLK